MGVSPGCESSVPPVEAGGGRHQGRVIALQGGFCRVRLRRPGPGNRDHLLCVRRSRLDRDGRWVVVGDQVWVEAIDWSSGRAVIAARESRRSLLTRPSVANCSHIHVVVSLQQPAFDPDQLSRFLITAEGTGLPVAVVLTKTDLSGPDAVAGLRSRIGGWGYASHPLCCVDGPGLEAYRRVLAAQPLTVLCGPSGAGKSSLLNALTPGLGLRVSAVSGRLERGRHTTRHVELLAVGDGALVADTPGFNRPSLPEAPGELAALFPEIRARLSAGRCRFRDCLHLDEPGCCVGRDWDRAPLYRRAVEEVCLAGRGEGGRRPGLRRRAG
ncbi:ribosome small subunit-dependent GTPase A [Synechococcus sp. RSCCF101]|uniref:ribosome small subunit-dependent GTPase A n=1 Tax=Synechococcus sp. RSCCF101 TaxID=2511069 RepID=UPI001246ECDD|nr:ribosome small subunit-dependent GTPase A [Synechococcus sp. RSCCF101]QEY32566.1 ribosome small subunit-dependent GTPase A [Synechococcus sp. RSCCF101]